jgi:hypothetical protein
MMIKMHRAPAAEEASMPIDIRVLHDGIGILYHCHGKITGKDFIDANSLLLTFTERLKQVRYGIVDETSIDDVQISDSEMLTIAVQDKKIAAFAPPGAVVAVIAKDDFALGLARMWESFITHTGWETMTFRVKWKAELWIIEKVKANFGIDLIFDDGITVS